MRKILGKYRNGNYDVILFNDGTKIRETEEDIFSSSFPESIDIKITNYCNGGCEYCHEGSTMKGKHGDLLRPAFIDSLKPYTEVAIGGGNPLSHPDLVPFLAKLKEKNIIPNMTVNQSHFMVEQEMIEHLVEERLIYGMGISMIQPSERFIRLVKKYDNAVIHAINGIFSEEDFNLIKGEDLKILILGYKELRFGETYMEKHITCIKNNQAWLYENISTVLEEFNVVSFDNLAIEQLNVRRLLTQDEWDEFYMGDDGQFTMYIDMIEQEYAKSSISKVRYKLTDDIVDMFNVVRNE